MLKIIKKDLQNIEGPIKEVLFLNDFFNICVNAKPGKYFYSYPISYNVINNEETGWFNPGQE